MSIKLAQETAIANPCQFAEQCYDRQYFHVMTVRKDTFTVGLTVNIGEE